MNKLSYYRIWKGLTQKQAAEIAKISISYYQEIETGRYKHPKIGIINRLAKYYKISNYQLFTYDNKNKK